MNARRDFNGRRHLGLRQPDRVPPPLDPPVRLGDLPEFFREHHSAEVENAAFRAQAANERLSREARRAIVVISLLALTGGLIILGILAINEGRPPAAPKVDFGAIASLEAPRPV